MCIMARRTFSFFKGKMSIWLLELLLQGPMTFPAEFLFLLNQKIFVFASMTIMAIRAYTLFESSMFSTLFDKIPDTFMTAQTESVRIIFHQNVKITCMCAVTV